ncbi:MAG: tripartite tricarboxylate transporter permease [Aminivibrio sp.]|jgi:putative tricarboxylic transport membrane protein
MNLFMVMFSQVDGAFLALVFAGSVAGLFVGAIPGLSVTMATALLVSITFTWSVKNALAVILGVFVSGVYAGAVSAILINIPGAPSSVVTTLDGYPMARRGEAGLALWAATFHSFVGSVFGFLVLMFVAKPMTDFALTFTAMDYFLLALFGLTTIGTLTAKNYVKGGICAIGGLLLSVVGIDPFTGAARFSFGIIDLQGGIPLIAALIGLFGFAEVLDQVARGAMEAIAGKAGKVKFSVRQMMAYLPLSIRSSVIGTFIGALPGAGGPVASIIAYDHAKKTVKNPTRPFGEGAIEGVIASEAANNACIGGALIPMLTLAVPGDAVTAVMLAAFYVHGLQPGPLLFVRTPELFATVLAGGFIACFALLLLGVTVVPRMAGVVLVPRKILLPVVSVLCVVGTYAVNSSMFDVTLMFLFGLAGFLMRTRGYPAAPLVLGLVLGEMMDSNLRRAINMAMAGDNMFMELFGRPSSLILSALVVISVLAAIPAVKERMGAVARGALSMLGRK